MKTLVGMCTYGGLEFTKLAINSIRNTAGKELDFFIVVGKPNDEETLNWLKSEGNISYKVHTENFGFPYAINDMYDHAWVYNNYDNLIIAGNDIVVYPNCTNSMLEIAESTDYEVISATQIDVRDLIKQYPNTAKYFNGPDCIFSDFSSKPWEEFKHYNKPINIHPMQLYDIQNYCLYKKSIFDKVGYTDVNFWPAYFVDNDYANRIVNSGAKACSLGNARFFHFWSRTIKQGSGGSTNHNFENNKKYYKMKWGGDVGKEKINAPIKIESREHELEAINKWKNK